MQVPVNVANQSPPLQPNRLPSQKHWGVFQPKVLIVPWGQCLPRTALPAVAVSWDPGTRDPWPTEPGDQGCLLGGSCTESVTRRTEAPLLETLVCGGAAEQGAEALPLRSDTHAASSGLSILQHQVVSFL